ncbi:MAG: BsuPI-related putative proteinase inhibitor [Dehalococcoidia bacterium]
MRRRRFIAALAALIAAAAVQGTARAQEPEAVDEPPPPPVSLMLSVTSTPVPRGEAVEFLLVLRNEAETPRTLTFTSSQRFDLAVMDGAGAVLWQWSAGRSFAQVRETLRLAPGEARTYTATWEPPTGAVQPGAYVAVAVLAAVEAPVAAPASFTLGRTPDAG